MQKKPCRYVKCTSILAIENIRSLSNPILSYSLSLGSCIAHASQECLLMSLWLNLIFEMRYILVHISNHMNIAAFSIYISIWAWCENIQQSISGQHPHTHTHLCLGAIKSSKSTNWHVSGRWVAKYDKFVGENAMLPSGPNTVIGVCIAMTFSYITGGVSIRIWCRIHVVRRKCFFRCSM